MPIEQQGINGSSAAVTLLKKRLSNFETEVGRLNGLSYEPRPNDVCISTTPKAGTTWVQQICHQLRCAEKFSEKCMDFEEISGVVPWIELAYDLGQDLKSQQPPDFGTDNLPRLFKTHCWYDHCPRFPKTIVVLRDPCDVLCSFYRFFEDWFFERDSIDIDTFAEEFWLARGIPDNTKMQNASYFVHLVSWYKHRHDTSSILFVFYEDLIDNLRGEVERIAQFLSNKDHNFCTEQVVRHTVQHSSFGFMKLHESRFDEKLTKLARNEPCGLPRDAGTTQSKIKAGKAGQGKTILSDHIRSKIEQKWKEVVLPVTGCTDYAELRTHLADAPSLAHNKQNC